MRIVVEHLTGPLAGLHQILGVKDKPLPDILTSQPSIKQALATGKIQTRSYGLITATPRYVLYREIAKHAALKQLNEFDPRQQ